MVGILKPTVPNIVLIDGDVIRDLFGKGLGFNEDARKVQIRRIQSLSLFLARQDIALIVAALYSHPELMLWNRNMLPGYFEVYVDTPLETVMARDTKGLYSEAKAGRQSNIVGVDIPWHIPLNPDMVVRTEDIEPIVIARRIIGAVPGLMSFKVLSSQ